MWPIIQGTIDELCHVEYGTRVVRKKDAGSKYPVYGGGGETFFLDSFNRENRVVVARFAMSERCTRRVAGKFALNDSGLTLSTKVPESLLQEYLDYLTLAMNDQIYETARGTAQKNLDVPSFRKMKIVYPNSIDKQREIVSKLDKAFVVLDKMTTHSDAIKFATSGLQSSLIGNWIKSLSTGNTAKLGDLAELKGRIGWRGLTAKEYTKKGPLFLSVHSLNHGHYVDFSRAFHISQERYEESPEIQVKKGYILIAKDGAGLGKVSMVGEVTEPTTVNSSLLVVKPKAQIMTKYLYCYFLSDAFRDLISSRLGGSTVPHLYQRDIAKIPVALLEMDQQGEFVKKFDISSKLVSHLHENYERRASLIIELRKAILHQTFSTVTK